MRFNFSLNIYDENKIYLFIFSSQEISVEFFFLSLECEMFKKTNACKNIFFVELFTSSNRRVNFSWAEETKIILLVDKLALRSVWQATKKERGKNFWENSCNIWNWAAFFWEKVLKICEFKKFYLNFFNFPLTALNLK